MGWTCPKSTVHSLPPQLLCSGDFSPSYFNNRRFFSHFKGNWAVKTATKLSNCNIDGIKQLPRSAQSWKPKSVSRQWLSYSIGYGFSRSFLAQSLKEETVTGVWAAEGSCCCKSSFDQLKIILTTDKNLLICVWNFESMKSSFDLHCRDFLQSNIDKDLEAKNNSTPVLFLHFPAYVKWTWHVLCAARTYKL